MRCKMGGAPTPAKHIRSSLINRPAVIERPKMFNIDLRVRWSIIDAILIALPSVVELN
jgi:hypothetical protein